MTDDTPERAAALHHERWPERLRTWLELLLDELSLAAPKIAEDERRRIACALVVRQCREFGGSQVYIPRAGAIERAVRDLAIWAEHDGTVNRAHGIRALARKHGITEVAVWKILRQQRALRRRLLAETPIRTGAQR